MGRPVTVSVIPPDFPEAACLGRPELFDSRRPDEPGHAKKTTPRHKAAIELCNACPHLKECAMWALHNHYDARNFPTPVLGGMTDFQRRQVRVKYGIPSPPQIPLSALWEVPRKEYTRRTA